ncbi:MAG: hypothetical protein ABSE47_10080 [Acidimicrobiales bacterium]|jgi:hypothetical protein
MRPPTDDTAVALLRLHVPEFEDQYLDLLDIYDEDLTPEIVFMELADYVANLLVSDESEESLERCLVVVEHIVATTDDGARLVASAFVNELPPGSREAARSYFGPITDQLADLVWHGVELDDDLLAAVSGGNGAPPATPASAAPQPV